MTPPTANFGEWFANLALLVSVAANLMLILASRRKQQREVTLTGEVVQKLDCDRNMERNREDHRELFKRTTTLESASAAAATAIDGLKTSMDDLKARVVLMDGKMDRLIERGL